MQSLGNHTFGGKKAIKIKSASGKKTPAKQLYAIQTKLKPDIMGEASSPTKSIYQIISQNIKMPEGLMNRGKYCGKSRLR